MTYIPGAESLASSWNVWSNSGLMLYILTIGVVSDEAANDAADAASGAGDAFLLSLLWGCLLGFG